MSELLCNIGRLEAQDRIDQLLSFERLLADLSASLVGAPEIDLDIDVNAALGAVAMSLGLDGLALWDLATVPGRPTVTHRWTAEGAPAPSSRLSADEKPWILGEIVGDHIVKVLSINDLPSAADVDIVALRASHVQSLLGIPLRSKGVAIGALILGFETMRFLVQTLTGRGSLEGKPRSSLNVCDTDRRAPTRRKPSAFSPRRSEFRSPTHFCLGGRKGLPNLPFRL